MRSPEASRSPPSCRGVREWWAAIQKRWCFRTNPLTQANHPGKTADLPRSEETRMFLDEPASQNGRVAQGGPRMMDLAPRTFHARRGAMMRYRFMAFVSFCLV